MVTAVTEEGVKQLLGAAAFLYLAFGITWWAFDSGPWSMEPRDILTETSPYGAVRVFGDDPELSHSDLAEKTVDALDDAGGFARNVVVVALPTGSGWVDPGQVEALEEWADGDIATVSMRYSRAPSAAVFLLRPDRARDSAQALIDGVVDKVSELPADRRPEVVVHGQSMGAVAGQGVLEKMALLPDVPVPDEAISEPPAGSAETAVAAVLWQGVPGGGNAETTESSCAVSVVNDDDPVAQLSLGLLGAPADLWRVLSELPGAASSVPGAGHSYLPVLPPAHCLESVG